MKITERRLRSIIKSVIRESEYKGQDIGDPMAIRTSRGYQDISSELCNRILRLGAPELLPAIERELSSLSRGDHGFMDYDSVERFSSDDNYREDVGYLADGMESDVRRVVSYFNLEGASEEEAYDTVMGCIQYGFSSVGIQQGKIPSAKQILSQALKNR